MYSASVHDIFVTIIMCMCYMLYIAYCRTENFRGRKFSWFRIFMQYLFADWCLTRTCIVNFMNFICVAHDNENFQSYSSLYMPTACTMYTISSCTLAAVY